MGGVPGAFRVEKRCIEAPVSTTHRCATLVPSAELRSPHALLQHRRRLPARSALHGAPRAAPSGSARPDRAASVLRRARPAPDRQDHVAADALPHAHRRGRGCRAAFLLRGGAGGGGELCRGPAVDSQRHRLPRAFRIFPRNFARQNPGPPSTTPACSARRSNPGPGPARAPWCWSSTRSTPSRA